MGGGGGAQLGSAAPQQTRGCTTVEITPPVLPQAVYSPLTDTVGCPESCTPIPCSPRVRSLCSPPSSPPPPRSVSISVGDTRVGRGAPGGQEGPQGETGVSSLRDKSDLG